MPVIVNESLSEATESCHRNGDCLAEHHSENENFLNKIAHIIEQELQLLPLEQADYGKIILLPMCRLGSHYSGSERNAPCSSSFWWGQYHATYFSYNLVGSRFRVRVPVYFLSASSLIFPLSFFDHGHYCCRMTFGNVAHSLVFALPHFCVAYEESVTVRLAIEFPV